MKEITLPDSGITLRVDRVPPILWADIRADIANRLPKPTPPIYKAKIGVDEIETEQANPADPAYRVAIQQHKTLEGQAILEALVEVTTECDVDEAKVKRLRAWAEKKKLPMPESDVVLYVTRVALETPRDIEFFRDTVLGLSQPTEKGIEQSLNNFRAPNGAGSKLPDLQGA